MINPCREILKHPSKQFPIQLPNAGFFNFSALTCFFSVANVDVEAERRILHSIRLENRIIQILFKRVTEAICSENLFLLGRVVIVVTVVDEMHLFGSNVRHWLKASLHHSLVDVFVPKVVNSHQIAILESIVGWKRINLMIV